MELKFFPSLKWKDKNLHPLLHHAETRDAEQEMEAQIVLTQLSGGTFRGTHRGTPRGSPTGRRGLPFVGSAFFLTPAKVDHDLIKVININYLSTTHSFSLSKKSK